ncbi:phenoloxidase subunit 1-like [Copidosoma floridanum]|uniref:phenoloxidase subunit 1-like n=1 Tax=Copidosoma floridanum TaxID=29053 RepID=UPI0006C97776|nr:phenoloxidase subunit 1-like [Copidosoma floridanum]
MKSEKYLSLLFDRPTEPLFMPKGDEKINFEVPPIFLSDDHQATSQSLQVRFGDKSNTSIKVPEIAIPDLSFPLSHDRNANFSLFIPTHKEKAVYLTDVFMKLRTVQDLLYVAASCRDRMNPQLFVYALSIAVLHRPDTRHVEIPKLCEIFPCKFMDSSIVAKAREDATVFPAGSRIPIEIPLNYTASDKDSEHHVAYFREDVGINLHHWHWHLVYPFAGPKEVVNKDRRGELVYYMHHQIMARYNTERLCNNLQRTKPLLSFRQPIPEAYFPKMEQNVAGRAWPARPANMTLSDINRSVDSLEFTLSDLETRLNRVREAIRTRTARDVNGKEVHLDDFTGIDILGNMMEASPVLSINFPYYGDIHNLGHVAVSYCHDPDHRYLESFSVMGDSATAMRDPVFYRWHQTIDDLFIQFKDSLTPYNSSQLRFIGVKVTEVGIISKTSNLNTLNTHWTRSDVDMSRGLDFAPRRAVLARLQHLNHNSFTYHVTVNNSNNRDVMGTVRVFLAPKYNEQEAPLSYNDQRKLMIEMDKFTCELKKGHNVIRRSSHESSVTIPYEATFRDLSHNAPESHKPECGCGWPQHMLVPKGTKKGYAMDLFVMITNYEYDRINQKEPEGCRISMSYCGLKDRKFPDARSMGFPFDRRAAVATLEQFLTPNMKVQTITVRFSDTVEHQR